MSLVEGEKKGFLWTLFLSGLEFLYAENVNQTEKRSSFYYYLHTRNQLGINLVQNLFKSQQFGVWIS